MNKTFNVMVEVHYSYLLLDKRNCNLKFHKFLSDYNFKNSDYIKNVILHGSDILISNKLF